MISYKVKAVIAKNLGTDDFALEEFESTYSNEDNPIKARREAFDYYDSIIDIIGEGKDDFEVIENHIKKLRPPEVWKYATKDLFAKAYDIGISVLLIVHEDEGNDFDEEDFELMILGNKAHFDELTVALNLEIEMGIYQKNNWDDEGWTCQIKYWDWEVDNIEQHTVLWTPFDFWEYHNPSNTIDISKENNSLEKSIIEQIIESGENRNVEFKSTLRYCLKTNEVKDYIEHSVTKTILAFANSFGGVLLIGVTDDGKILGLENDIDSFKDKSKDSFLKHFGNLLKSHFTKPIDALLHYDIEEADSKLIFKINVRPSDQPRFLKTKLKGKEFYIRRPASSESLDVEETAEYILSHWGRSDNNDDTTKHG